MSERQAWPGQPYLDELRPERGATVRLALFATYSVDVSAVAAALLALIGRNNDKGGGSAVDFAQAVDSLRDKVRILIQRGRIVRPAALPKIAGILDQFIVEQRHDERYRSWHPKIVLVAYEGPGERTSWKLWVGSRNLTKSRDFDAGVLIEGGSKRGKGRARLGGIGELGARLARDAGLGDADAIRAELDGLWWEAPPGYGLRGLLDGLADDVGPNQAPPPGDIQAVTIVSPFLDATFVARAGTWGPDGARTLVSSGSALVALANVASNPLKGFSKLLAYAAPQEAEDETADPEAAEVDGDDEEPPPPSLHAKIYSFTMADDEILRVGSANATSRAWSGRNAEIMLELSGGEHYRRGLGFLTGSAIPVSLSDLAAQTPADTSAADALEASRLELTAAWSPVLLREGDRFTLDAGVALVLSNPAHRLEAGHATGDRIPWPEGSRLLPLGVLPLSHQSAFIQLRLLGPEGDLCWMQRVEVRPDFEPGRDLAALARHMGLRAFHDWMRAMLGGDLTSVGGADWDDESGTGPTRREGLRHDRLTLEDILSAWARDRAAFGRVDRHFSPYVDAILEHGQELTDRDKADLTELSALWAMVRERLTL